MTLEDLATIVDARADAGPKESWTATLLARGPEKAAEKFGEEAIEAVIEAVRGNRKRLAEEAADVLYHLIVMLKSREVALTEVMAVLEGRQGTSGLAERAGRQD